MGSVPQAPPKHYFSNSRPLIQHPAASRLLGFLALCLLGVFATLPATRFLYGLWTNDPLRSIGLFFPFVAIGLVLLAWRRIGWQLQPSAWSLPCLALGAACAWLMLDTSIELRLLPTFALEIPLAAIAWILTFSGILLALGGTPLLRRSLFPLFLLLCVNVAPHSFNRLIDLPLQQRSAGVARHFAHLLGLHPTGDQITLLFTPRFGMVIIPGCNGLRGALTLAYLALLLGYLRQFKWWKTLLCAAAALLLGYLLNLLRLCLLTVYYWLGVHFPSMQQHGTAVDYCIGGTLFALTVAIFVFVFHPTHAEPPAPAPAAIRHLPRMAFLAAAVLTIAATAQTTLALLHHETTPQYLALDHVQQRMPQNPAGFRNIRTWTEIDQTGRLGWVWNEYQTTTAATPATIQLGVMLAPTPHDAMQSERFHGRYPLSISNQIFTDNTHQRASFVTFVTSDADREIPTLYFAETNCSATQCKPQNIAFSSLGIIFAHRDRDRIARTLLIKTEGSNPAAAQQLTQQLTAAINLRTLTQ